MDPESETAVRFLPSRVQKNGQAMGAAANKNLENVTPNVVNIPQAVQFE